MKSQRMVVARVAVLVTCGLAVGCLHPYAYVPGVDCFGVPGEYVPGTTTDTRLENMSSAYLRLLREPILWKSEAHPDRTLRLFVAPQDHPPIAIRLLEQSDGWAVRASSYAGAGGRCPDDFPFFERQFGIRRSNPSLTSSEWTRIETLL